jgi:hypothetical protein
MISEQRPIHPITITAKDADGQIHIHTVVEENIAKTIKMMQQRGLFGIKVNRD